MDEAPLLTRIAALLERHGLEAVLIGNAAAALQARDSDALQIDFMSVIDGVRSFESLRKRARSVRFGNAEIRVAGLADIIRSKKAAGRAQDMAVLGVLEKTLEETSRHAKGQAGRSQARE